MTDISPSDDELVSSYLDHEATPGEVARVEGDPRLMARVKEMRAAIAFVATPPPLPEAALDRIRATAVAAVGSETSASTAPVVDMATARIKRLERRNRILTVAAAVLLFGGLIGGIGFLGTSEGDDSAGAGSSEGSSDDSDGDESSFGTMTDSNDSASSDSASNDSASDVGTDAQEAELTAEVDMESGADESADDSSDSALTEGDEAAIRLQKNSSFDPLPDNLGVYASAEELAAAVETMVNEMTVDDDEAEDAPAKFRPLTTCEKTLAVALAGDMAFEFDTAEAVFEATVYTIVVGRLFDTADSVGRIAPSNTCSPIIELFVSP
jgi:hypothetical protein